MRARLPKSVNIIGQEYRVRRVPKLQSEEDGERLNGELNDNTLNLRIDKGLPRSKEQEFMLHEVLHACFYEVQGLDGDAEEKCVSAISHRLLKVLQDNPKLIAFLTT